MLLRFSLFLILACFTFPVRGIASESEALALLKGVEQERMKYDCFRIFFTEDRGDGLTVPVEVDFDRGKIRAVYRKTGDFPGWTQVLDGNEAILFADKPHEDAQVMNVTATDVRVSRLYDPRTLGLDDVTSFALSVSDCLLYSRFSGFTVENGTLDGSSVKIVSVADEIGEFHLYITEPGFRLLKKTFKGSGLEIQVISKYENPELSPFPSEIKVLRKKNGTITRNNTKHIISFEVRKSFPPDTFTYKSMNLPLNTAVVDCRIQRRLGYWDGEKLVDDPVSISAQERREWEEKLNRQPLGNTVRCILGATGILLIVFAVVSMIRRRKPETVSR